MSAYKSLLKITENITIKNRHKKVLQLKREKQTTPRTALGIEPALLLLAERLNQVS